MPKKKKTQKEPVSLSFSVTETGPETNAYNTMVDSSANVPDEDQYVMHMGRAIGSQNTEFAMWKKIMKFAEDVYYERVNNIRGTH